MLESEARELEQKLNHERDGGEGAGLSQAVSTVMKWAWRAARRRTVESGSLQWDHALEHRVLKQGRRTVATCGCILGSLQEF